MSSIHFQGSWRVGLGIKNTSNKPYQSIENGKTVTKYEIILNPKGEARFKDLEGKFNTADAQIKALPDNFELVYNGSNSPESIDIHIKDAKGQDQAVVSVPRSKPLIGAPEPENETIERAVKYAKGLIESNAQAKAVPANVEFVHNSPKQIAVRVKGADGKPHTFIAVPQKEGTPLPSDPGVAQAIQYAEALVASKLPPSTETAPQAKSDKAVQLEYRAIKETPTLGDQIKALPANIAKELVTGAKAGAAGLKNLGTRGLAKAKAAGTALKTKTNNAFTKLSSRIDAFYNKLVARFSSSTATPVKAEPSKAAPAQPTPTALPTEIKGIPVTVEEVAQPIVPLTAAETPQPAPKTIPAEIKGIPVTVEEVAQPIVPLAAAETPQPAPKTIPAEIKGIPVIVEEVAQPIVPLAAAEAPQPTPAKPKASGALDKLTAGISSLYNRAVSRFFPKKAAPAQPLPTEIHGVPVTVQDVNQPIVPLGGAAEPAKQ